VRGVHKIVEGEEVTGIAQLAADGQDFVSGLYEAREKMPAGRILVWSWYMQP